MQGRRDRESLARVPPTCKTVFATVQALVYEEVPILTHIAGSSDTLVCLHIFFAEEAGIPVADPPTLLAYSRVFYTHERNDEAPTWTDRQRKNHQKPSGLSCHGSS